MRHLKPISLIAVIAMLGVFSFHAFSAITTTFDYNTPADFTLDTEYNQEITDGELVLGEQYEVQINDKTEGSQFYHYATELSNGDVFVTWTSNDPNHSGDDANGYHVAAKIIDKFGQTVLDEFQVNQSIEGDQFPYDVITLDDGNVMVIYYSVQIKGIVYNSSGEVVVNEFQINDLTDGSISYTEGVKMSNGNFLVSWRSTATGTADNDGRHVAAKIIGPDGSTVVSEFLVNETYGDNQFVVRPFLLEGSSEAEDKVMVTWLHGAATTYDIYAKIYNLDGTVSKSEFTLVSGAGVQDIPDIAKIEDDVFFIIYESDDTAVGSDVSSSAVEGKVVDMEGIELLSPFEINEETDGFQFEPMASLLSNGDIYLTWSSQDTDHAGDDNDGYHIAGKVINIADDGGELAVTTVAPEFQVNKVIETDQRSIRHYVYDGTIMNFFYSDAPNPRYGDDDGRHVVLLPMKEDLTYYKDVYSPSSTLSSGVEMDESLRQVVVEYGSGNEEEVSMQISNDDGLTWFYFDGDAWVETGLGVDESNSQNVVNANLDTFYSDQGVGGTFNIKLFLNSDGTEEVIVDILSILENEVPIIGNGDPSVSVDVEENETRVAQFVSTDPESDDTTFNISGGEDSELFSLDENRLLSISLDGDLGETYQVVVRSTDEFGGVSDQTVNVTVVRVAPSNGSSSGGSTPNPFGGTLTVDNETEVETQNEEPKVKVQQGLFYKFLLKSLGFDFAGFLYDLFN